MGKKPDFFLSAAGESDELATPRACWTIGRLTDNHRDDYMLIKIEPSLSGQKFGLGDKEIEHLVIATRHKGFTLFPVTEWPSFVYIARILDESIVKTGVMLPNQVEPLSWGMIFRTYDDANLATGKNSNGSPSFII